MLINHLIHGSAALRQFQFCQLFDDFLGLEIRHGELARKHFRPRKIQAIY